VEQITGLKYTSNEVKKHKRRARETNIAIRVIVDHRASAVALQLRMAITSNN
jgi:alanyl-tRNA synthetase